MSRLAGETPFPKTAPYVAHSATSKEAAASIAPKMREQHRQVWRALRDAGGLTDEEGIAATGLPASTYRPRRIELCDAGFAEDSGHTKRGKSGRSATVWRCTTKGRVA